MLARAAFLLGASLLLAAVSGGSLQALAGGAPPEAPASPDITLTPDAAAGASQSAPAAPYGEDSPLPSDPSSPTGSPSPSVSPSPSASPSPGPDTLRVGWLGGPDAVNPLSAFSTQARLVIHLGHDLLTGYRAGDLGPAPELAESWTHSEDGLTWTFTIREGATWGDGMPVTAADVAFTFTYVMEHQISPYAATTIGIQSVEATDDRTVVFTCSEPKADILSMWVPILPAHLWAAVDPAEAAAAGAAAAAASGGGPFRVVSFVAGKTVKLRANEDYWRGRPEVDEIVFTAYTDAAKMARDLETGALDACWGVPAAGFERLRRDRGVLAVAVPGRSSVQLGFTCSERPDDANPALRDPLFRQAISWAVDRRRIVATAFDGFATVGSTIIAPGLRRDPDYHYEPSAEEKSGYDLEKAAALLAEAGYLKIAGRRLDTDREPVRLRLYACEAPPQGKRIALAIARNLRALGIDVEYTVLPETTMRGRLSITVDGLPRPDADLFISDWIGDRDPSFILSVLTSGQIGTWNDTGWSDHLYDELFAEQAATLDQGARKDIVDQMQRLAAQQSPYIVIAYPQSLEAVDTGEWLGWVQAPAGTGSAIGSVDNIDSYLYVHRRSAVAPAPAEAPWWVWPALTGAMLAGAGSVGAAWFVTRRAVRSPSPHRCAASPRSP